MWRAIRSVFGGDRARRRATLDGRNSDWFDGPALPFAAAAALRSSADSLSLVSNPSVSSYDSSTRRRHHKHIATQYFGPNSQTNRDLELEGGGEEASPVEASAGSSYGEAPSPLHGGDGAERATAQRRDETPEQREARKANERAFESLVHLANTNQPVTLDAFKRKRRSLDPTLDGLQNGGVHAANSDNESEDDDDDFTVPLDKQLNTELIEAYVAYARSIGHEPEIQVAIGEPQSGDEEEALAAERLSFVHERRHLRDSEHWGTQWVGTRYSKRRGCLQFWSFLALGVVVTVVMVVFLSQVRLNEVLHLDAFTGSDVAVASDVAFMHLRDEVGFRLKYEIEAADRDFQVLLLTDKNFARYAAGEPFAVLADGSRTRTRYASLPPTRFANAAHNELFLVVQPCFLPQRNASLDFCRTDQLPQSLSSSTKLFALRKAVTASDGGAAFVLRSFYVNPMPDTCAASGWKGAPFLLLLVPYLVAALFGLRVFHMALHCESFRANLERNYRNEFAMPDAEVDYWQPTPWDRKVPKTRLLGPCCWRKMRRPREPFYTWWRHENYFTWVLFPYRHELLSRGERAIIIFCSLYITFYVTFLLAMLHAAMGDALPVAGSVAVYWLLLVVLPSLGKAVFKEIFKLIFRQRRKYFRLKAAGGDTSRFSFRLAFLLQLFVVLSITLAQGPMAYIWLHRSCAFLSEFVYFGALAAFARLSLFGLLQDLGWYAVLSAWGWRDLCPHCTERLAACDCFNDELLVLAVERVGAKWELILLLDRVLSRHAGHEPQFAQYSAQQLHERWAALVARAERHLEKVEQLHAYRLKKQRDAARRRMSRLSLRLMERASFRLGEAAPPQHENDASPDLLGDVDSARERKILALHRKIRLDGFEKHYDSTIVDVFRSMQQAVRGVLRRGDGGRDAAQPRPPASPVGVESSMSVAFTTPAQRLARREDERERRARVFRVLGGYRIEKKHTTDADEQTQRTAAVGGKQLPSATDGARRQWWWPWWRPLGAALGHTRELLLLPSQSAESAADADADIVVVVTEDPALERGDEEEDGAAAARSAVSDAESYCGGGHASGSRLHTQAYEVSERAPTLWEQTVAPAGALVGWLLKYDSSQY